MAKWGGGGGLTVSGIAAEPDRPAGPTSLIVAWRLNEPLTFSGTFARNVNTRFDASGVNAWFAAPPMSVRLATTDSIATGGTPCVTSTRSSVDCPERIVDGDADPCPVGPTFSRGVIEKSSTARPSSAPLALKSVQRIQNVAPFGMLRF